MGGSSKVRKPGGMETFISRDSFEVFSLKFEDIG